MRVFWVLFLSALALPALAADPGRYSNARFGYTLQLPQDFSVTPDSDKGDGVTLMADDGRARLIVFANRFDGDFVGEASRRIAAARSDRWVMSYERITPEWVSFSGARDRRFLYERGIPLCNGTAAFFQMEYQEVDRIRYDGVIRRLVSSLKPSGICPF
jgi:hypothetical protein